MRVGETHVAVATGAQTETVHKHGVGNTGQTGRRRTEVYECPVDWFKVCGVQLLGHHWVIGGGFGDH